MCSRSLSSLRGVHQVSLLVGQRADFLFRQQVHDHPHAGERRLELVRYHRQQLVLHLVDLPKIGHIRQHDQSADQVLLLIQDRIGLGQEVQLLPVVLHLDRAFIAGQVSRRQIGQRPVMQIGQPARRQVADIQLRIHCEQPLCGLVRQLDSTVRIDHHHRIGQAVDRQLRRALDPQQLLVIDALELAEAGRPCR